MKTRYPSIRAVRSALVSEQKYLRRSFARADLIEDDEDSAGTDCRLQVHEDGGWDLRVGSSDYDQDHRGFWGCGSIPYDRANLTELARELIEDAKDCEAMQRD